MAPIAFNAIDPSHGVANRIAFNNRVAGGADLSGMEICGLLFDTLLEYADNMGKSDDNHLKRSGMPCLN